MRRCLQILGCAIAALIWSGMENSTAHAQETPEKAPSVTSPTAIRRARGTSSGLTAINKKPKMDDDAELPVFNATTVSATLPPSSGKPTVILTGEQMSGEGFAPPHIERGGMQLLSHYGAISGIVSLSRDMSGVRAQLKPRIKSGSAPVVTLFLDRIGGGKYLRIPVLVDQSIENDQEISKAVNVPKGTYRVTLGFFKASKSDRPHLEVYSISVE